MKGTGYALVVDNSPVIRRMVSSFLEKEGWRVRTAENGLEALDVINDSKPEIIFTDLIMPKIDGEKLTYIVRNTKGLKDIFLVILSGVAMEDDDNTKGIGANVCIAKGPAGHMRKHIIAALHKYETGEDTDNEISGMEGLYPREVTRELMVNKKHRDVIIASMTEGVVEVNNEGRVVMANRAAIDLFGIKEAAVFGTKIQEMIEGRDSREVAKWFDSLENTIELPPLVYNLDNPVRIVGKLVTMSLVATSDMDEIIVIGMLKDVTRRVKLEQKQKQLEKELQRIQKIDAMSVMAGGIAHDFNNLLTIINGNVEMCRYWEKDDQKKNLLIEAGKALNLTNQLIKKFTTFSDNYLPQREQADLKELISETLKHELLNTDILFTINGNVDNTRIKVDPALISQVFVNLTHNAVDVMGNEGMIKVSIDTVDGTDEARKNNQPIPDGELTRIIFEDNGPGISSKIIDKVFDPYFSTKQKGAQKGMGLGLTIVHSIIKKHDGIVWINSKPGAGCSVHMYFSSPKPIVTDEKFFDAVSKGKSERKKVLIMDDDEMMRVISRKMFEHCQCDVSVAIDAEEAVSLFKKAEVENNSFDLLLLDLRIKGGPGGVEVSEEILAIDPTQKIIIISGDAGHEVVLNYQKFGFIAALTKPFSLDAVVDVVQHFLVEMPER